MVLGGTMLTQPSIAADKTFRLEEATISDIQQAFSSGSLTGAALVQLYLERIAAYDKAGPNINSIITVNPKAREEAAALDRERATSRDPDAAQGQHRHFRYGDVERFRNSEGRCSTQGCYHHQGAA
jgi:hypothetical protein